MPIHAGYPLHVSEMWTPEKLNYGKDCSPSGKESSEAQKLAEAHWDHYVGPLCRMHYVTAFVHGHKHGEHDAKSQM